MSCQRHQLI
jgi:hypothetical protein